MQPTLSNVEVWCATGDTRSVLIALFLSRHDAIRFARNRRSGYTYVVRDVVLGTIDTFQGAA